MRRIYQVSIVDPNSLSTEGVKHALNGRGFHLVDRWTNVDEAIDRASSASRPDAILLNQAKSELPDENTVSALRQAFPETRIALIGESSNPERIRNAIRSEFDGFILETISITAFPKAIELLILGERVFPPLPLETIAKTSYTRGATPTTSALDVLSATEMRVLALLSNALANKVIARDLGISESTVKVHVKSILRKTGSRNRTDAALLVQGIRAKTYGDDLEGKKIDGLLKIPPLNGTSNAHRI